jgi:hypothetical protein
MIAPSASTDERRAFVEQPSVTPIDIVYPEASDRHLRISVGACRLDIVPSEGDAWVSGTYQDPSGALPCQIVTEGGTIRITQNYNVPDLIGLWDRPPHFELALGKTRPFPLTLEVGASESRLDLGGVPISRLVVRQGAGKYAIDFSAPNPHPMSLLTLSAGAAGMEITNLANANCAELNLEGGAAAYVFDFGGTLQRDAHVRVATGLSSVEIRVPATTAAKIVSESLLGSLDADAGFKRQDGAFWTEAALAGATPLLTINTNVALGSLRLVTT